MTVDTDRPPLEITTGIDTNHPPRFAITGAEASKITASEREKTQSGHSLSVRFDRITRRPGEHVANTDTARTSSPRSFVLFRKPIKDENNQFPTKQALTEKTLKELEAQRTIGRAAVESRIRALLENDEFKNVPGNDGIVHVASDETDNPYIVLACSGDRSRIQVIKKEGHGFELIDDDATRSDTSMHEIIFDSRDQQPDPSGNVIAVISAPQPGYEIEVTIGDESDELHPFSRSVVRVDGPAVPADDRNTTVLQRPSQPTNAGQETAATVGVRGYGWIPKPGSDVPGSVVLGGAPLADRKKPPPTGTTTSSSTAETATDNNTSTAAKRIPRRVPSQRSSRRLGTRERLHGLLRGTDPFGYKERRGPR